MGEKGLKKRKESESIGYRHMEPGTTSLGGVKWGRNLAFWQIKKNIRKYNPCCLLSSLIVADAGDKCIWF